MTASNPGGLSTSATGAGSTRSSQEPGSPGLEQSIARLLTAGTYASIALLAVGFSLLLASGNGPLSGGPSFDAGRLLADLAAGRPEGFIWVGLLVVIATPTARVVASLIGFGRRGERGMVAIAGLVLVVIGISVVLGRLES